MKFFEFKQNNSGGTFDIDDNAGIGPCVWIEAIDVDDAARRAETIGIYFDGVEDGRDCDCCGDRWYRPYGDGLYKPNVSQKYDFYWSPVVYIHRFDGSIERLTKSEKD